MTTTKSARPTEYKGVVYRSKSEAMYAASIHSRGHKWIYEPRFLDLDGWRPDFAIPVHNGNEFGFEVIEYKPYRPTETYLTELAKRFFRLRKTVNVPFSGYLASFNWFDCGQSADMAWCFDEWDGQPDSIVQMGQLIPNNFLSHASIAYALNYRFDLVEGGP